MNTEISSTSLRILENRRITGQNQRTPKPTDSPASRSRLVTRSSSPLHSRSSSSSVQATGGPPARPTRTPVSVRRPMTKKPPERLQAITGSDSAEILLTEERLSRALSPSPLAMRNKSWLPARCPGARYSRRARSISNASPAIAKTSPRQPSPVSAKPGPPPFPWPAEFPAPAILPCPWSCPR